MPRRGTRIAGFMVVLVVVAAGCAGGIAGDPSPTGTPAGPTDQPRNVILMIGDGMGPAHVELARRFAGGVLSMDALDSDPGSMTHDNAYGEVTDSAASATAMATGHKTRNGAMSVDVDGYPLETVWELAEANGKSTGIVSSVFLVDATPGVWAAHAASRHDYSGIARQQALGLGPDSWGGRAGIDGVEVLLGSGAAYYRPQGANGTGDLDLIDELKARGYEYVTKASELGRAAAPQNRLLGLFGDDALTYVLDRPLTQDLTEPTLAEMTAKALEVVRDDPDGFFLVVEGGAIDWTAHAEDAAGTLHEVIAFDQAVEVARRFAATDTETLLVVAADHETGGLVVGPGTNLQFLAGVRATVGTIWAAIEGGMSIDAAMKTYAGIGGPWPALSAQETAAIRACGNPLGIADVLNARAGVGWGSSRCEGEGHTSTEVPVFASGPGAEAFDGNLDNTDIGIQLRSAVTAD